MNKIKVVASIGSDADEKIIQDLIYNGVDAIKMNMSELSREYVRNISEIIRRLNKKLDTGIGVMVEIGGPTIRVGKMLNGSAYFNTGDKIRLYKDEVLGDETKASISYEDFIKEVKKDDDINISNGNVKLKVYDKGNDYIICEVIKGGDVTDYANVNIKSESNEPFLRVKDIKDVEFASSIKADFIELPRIKSSDDVMQVTDMLISLRNDHTNVISRIDSLRAYEEIDDIVKISDGVLIDRNGLSMDVPMERIPGMQKIIINKCLRMGKISIASVDMPINNSSVPTRIEVQDIANAALDGVDAILMSDVIEDSNSYIKSIKNMESILKEVEESIDYIGMYENASREEAMDVTGMIATNVAGTAAKLKCKAIITPTITGYTARKISRFRPSCPIVAASPNMETVTSLSLHFGVNPVLIDDLNSLDKIIKVSENITKGLIPLTKGDKIIITGGYPFKESKNTNFMKIEEL
nr:hypothetical protein [Bacilli bacterium]